MNDSPNDQGEGEERPRRSSVELAVPLEVAPQLLRLYVGALWRTAGWTVDTALRASRRLAEAAVSGESAAELVDDLQREARDNLRRLIGVSELEQRFGGLTSSLGGSGENSSDPTEALRRRGAELLSRSSEVLAVNDDDVHPAYDRLLTQLSPDEARILRLLITDGPQAVVDVRTWRPLGIGAEVVEANLSMIDKHAGVMRPEWVPAYLVNLFRLGLITFSRNPVHRLDRYQVLEAQPEVLEALKRAGRGRTVRRSIELTPFGAQFCKTCLPMHTSEFEVLGPEPGES